MFPEEQPHEDIYSQISDLIKKFQQCMQHYQGLEQKHQSTSINLFKKDHPEVSADGCRIALCAQRCTNAPTLCFIELQRL